MSDIAITAGEDYTANPEKQPRPYVRFVLKPKETKTADGKLELTDVAWVQITPAGGRDMLEKTYDDWIRDLKLHADNGRVPPQWPGEYARAYKAWREGQEIPVNGYPIKLWAPLSPAQRESVLRANIFTVQDLALANDEAKGRIGMGAVSLVQMAQAWVEDQKGSGALAARLEAAVVAREAAEARIKVLDEHIAALEALVPADKRPKRPELAAKV